MFFRVFVPVRQRVEVGVVEQAVVSIAPRKVLGKEIDAHSYVLSLQSCNLFNKARRDTYPANKGIVVKELVNKIRICTVSHKGEGIFTSIYIHTTVN